jgi:hypothetical protein
LWFGLKSILFSNHLYGQDILHVDVYDEDSVKDEKIGSVLIDLHQLYQSGLVNKAFFFWIFFYLLIGHIDEWFDLPGKSASTSYGQVHLILDFERLRV